MIDLGDISNARGTEMWVALRVRLLATPARARSANVRAFMRFLVETFA